MKDIGIVTLYYKNYNFGGLLQAYALPKVLENHFGVLAEQISYDYNLEAARKIDMSHVEKSHKSLYQLGIYFFFKLNKKNMICREKLFNRFIEEIYHSDNFYTGENIKTSVKKYKKFICGGDQIWIDHKCNVSAEIFTLQFVPKETKKISYAPSMANLEMSDEFKATFERGIAELDAISVREKSSVPVLEKMTEKPIHVVVDPVLLLQQQEWIKAAKMPEIKQPYLLCYLLGDSVEQRKVVQKLAKKLNLKILTFPYILCNVVRKCDLFFGDIRDYTSGPREFIGLIQNAQLVVTDSFHASVFSMIFETPFYVFERDKATAKNSTNRRIYDFLKEYHLEHQLVSEEELGKVKNIPQVDFNYAQEHWAKRREESLEYLEHALELKRRKDE